MRIIDSEPVRDKILKRRRFIELRNIRLNRRCGLEMLFNGYISALDYVLEVIESEKPVGTIIGDNNLHKLSVKERKHHVQQRD